ncbi:MAG TPA: STAS domain-containing protein [Phycisphaerales bacterium]|nr:STAS domain-containing protein [Phycisphaerales bacterium]
MPTQWSESIVIAELADEPELSEELSAIFARLTAETVPGATEAPSVVLNFSGVRHLNSSHLAQLLRLRKRMTEIGRSLVLCSLGDDLWSVMMLTGLDKVFRFATDPVTALASLQLEEAGGG